MKNQETWQPTKFMPAKRGWRANRDPRVVGTGSRFLVRLLADHYPRMVEKYAQGDLLDFGCGEVPLFGMYRHHVETVTCLDWAQGSHDTRHVDILADLSASVSDLPAGCADTIVATDVLEHLPYPDRAWKEFRRLCRDGGHVLVGVPFLYWIHEAPHDFHRYTRYALERHATEAGFEVIDLWAYGGPLEVLVDLLAKLTAAIRPLSGLVTLIGSLLHRIPAVRRLSSRGSHVLPLGYCVVARARVA